MVNKLQCVSGGVITKVAQHIYSEPDSFSSYELRKIAAMSVPVHVL